MVGTHTHTHTHTHIYKQVFACVSLCILLVMFLTASLRGQNVTGDFSYSEPCGCGGVVELTIYNGLYGAYGGQLVSDADEESLGAITIANLNDTDGDGIIDNVDNSIASTPGRAVDIDLSKLTIELTGAVAPTCEFVSITLSSNLRLWDSQNKGAPIPNRIPVADLPKDVYVEAIAVSSTMRDYNITVGLLDETGTVVKSDRVVVTALWVEHLASYRTYSSTPTPMSLGIDEGSLIHVLNTQYIASSSRFRKLADKVGSPPFRVGLSKLGHDRIRTFYRSIGSRLAMES